MHPWHLASTWSECRSTRRETKEGERMYVSEIRECGGGDWIKLLWAWLNPWVRRTRSEKWVFSVWKYWPRVKSKPSFRKLHGKRWDGKAFIKGTFKSIQSSWRFEMDNVYAVAERTFANTAVCGDHGGARQWGEPLMGQNYTGVPRPLTRRRRSQIQTSTLSPPLISWKVTSFPVGVHQCIKCRKEPLIINIPGPQLNKTFSRKRMWWCDDARLTNANSVQRGPRVRNTVWHLIFPFRKTGKGRRYRRLLRRECPDDFGRDM